MCSDRHRCHRRRSGACVSTMHSLSWAPDASPHGLLSSPFHSGEESPHEWAPGGSRRVLDPFCESEFFVRLWGHHASAHVPCRADVLNLFLACIAQTGSVGWQRLDSSRASRWGPSTVLCWQLPPLSRKRWTAQRSLSLFPHSHFHFHSTAPPLPTPPSTTTPHTNTVMNTLRKKLSRKDMQQQNPAGPSQTASNNPSGGVGKASKVLGEKYVSQQTQQSDCGAIKPTPADLFSTTRSVEGQVVRSSATGNANFRASQFIPPTQGGVVQTLPGPGETLSASQLARMRADPKYAAAVNAARERQERGPAQPRRSSPAPGQQTPNFSYPIPPRTQSPGKRG